MKQPLFFAGSDRGLIRRENEDSYLLHIPEEEAVFERKGILAIVADGVGGGPAGEKASSMAADIIKDLYYRHPGSDNMAALQEAFESADIRIREEAVRDARLRGMATTCTAFVAARSEGFMCHAGDSRAYLFRGKELSRLSEDHTLVNEMITEGIITPEEARTHPQRNIILRSLGSVRQMKPDTLKVDLRAGDTLLLCSDGLHGYSSDEEISAILSRHPADEAGRLLIELALRKGGPDNVTVVLVSL